MAFRKRIYGAGKLLVIAGALVLTYLVSAVISMQVALRSRDVQVPDLVNRTTSEASGLVAPLDLSLQVDEVRRADLKIPTGRVAGQDPPAGATSRRQRTVKVWLSAGPRATTTPEVTGESQRAAEARLAQSGFPVRAVSEIRSQDYPADAVIAQQPPARTPAANVAILVNRRDRGATYVMPDLIGLNGDRSAEVLRQRGFRASVVGSTPYPGVVAGIVVRQNPQAGYQIEPGEAISLEVSR
jgi:eukaryotic-like serine/threonine-protein kinase